MDYEWDPAKAAANLKKHKVRFSDAALSLEDPAARTIADPDASGEGRYLCLAADPAGHVLVTVFAPRGEKTSIISSRKPVARKDSPTRQSDEKAIRLFESKAWTCCAGAQ
jgi:uncharacterized DUF497 family protein